MENSAKKNNIIDIDSVLEFVSKVEDSKKFKRDLRLVFAHIVEETGELARSIYLYEREAARVDYPDPAVIGRELIDIIFLSIYLTDILGINLPEQIINRRIEIAKTYGLIEEAPDA